MEFDKSRVYTVLNADELKVGDKVIVADDYGTLKRNVEDGERAFPLDAVYSEFTKDRFGIKYGEYNTQSYHLAYLVQRAQEKKWRAYKDCDEMVEDFKKRYGNAINADNPMWHPLIWVKKKRCNSCHLVIDIYKNLRSVILNCVECSLEDLFEYCTYMDGSPCGVEE